MSTCVLNIIKELFIKKKNNMMRHLIAFLMQLMSLLMNIKIRWGLL